MNCQLKSPFVEQAAAIFTQVFMIFLFLTLFFFMVVVKVEKDIFIRQINLIVDSLIQDWGRLIGLVMPLDRTQIKAYKQKLLNSLTDEKTIDQDQAQLVQSIKEQNEKIEQSAHDVLIAFGIIIGAGIITLMILRFCLKPMKHLWENILLIGFIGLTEFLFLELVIQKYTSVNPNKVKLLIIQSINKFAAQQM